MSKLSVKKPFTVLVGVILVLVLGVVSFTRMTTDLLPNMDLPYMVVYTTSPGAAPETVESSVTKPMEAALGATTGIKNINSVSSENLSMIILEFEQDTDMNAVSIEMSNTIDQIEGSLPDTASTPVMMQITPDMLPVMVASVDVDGMESEEISDYVSDTLLSRFERLDGVASVSTSGLLTSRVTVTLDQDKIDELNDRVLEQVDSELADAKEQLDEGQLQLEDAQAELEDGQETLDAQSEAVTEQLAEASAQVDTASAQLSAILSEETTLQANQAAFQLELETLQPYAGQNDQLQTAAVLLAAFDQLASIPTAVSFPPTEDELAALASGSSQLLKSLQDPISYLEGISDEAFSVAVQALAEAAPEGLDLSQLSGVSRTDFVTLLTAADYAAGRVEEIEAELNNITTRMATISAMKPELEAGLEQAQEAYEELEAGKIQAVTGIAEGSAQLAIGSASLESAQQQLDEAREEFEAARDEAYENADISGIVTADMISSILIAENFEMPAGYVKDSSGASYVLKVGETFESIDELKNMLLFHMDLDGIGDIYLSDVAEVGFSSETEDDSYAKVNGNDAVILSFSKQSTASTSAVSDAINEEIEALEAEGASVHVTPLMDQGDYIHLIINNVLSNLIYGGLLAVVVLILFLRDIRPTVIIAFSIPLSVLFAVVLMYFSDMTLNLISLSGLSLGVGMLVDNSIVVIENIYRLRGLGVPPARAAVQGAKQMSGAIFASTLTTICVFLPIVFTQGIARQLFTDMGLTIAYSLSASLIVALTVVPAMGASMLKRETTVRAHSRFDGFLDRYARALRWCLDHKVKAMSVVIALFVLACVAAARIGLVFIPEMSSNQMSATLTMPEDSDQVTEDAVVDRVLKLIQNIDGVDTVGALRGGSSVSLTSGSGDSTTYYIILEDGADNQAVADAISEQTEPLVCEIDVSTSNMDLSSLTGSGVQIDVYGDDLDELQTVCAELAEKLESVDGLEDISDGNEDPDEEKVITVDKDKAMREGLTVAQVYSSLASELSDEVESTTLKVGQDEYPVVVIKPTEVRAETLLQQTVESTDQTTGETEDVKLGDIAAQSESQAPTSISRENNERTMTVSASVDADHNATLLSREVQDILDDYDLPDGMRAEISGESETVWDAMEDLLLMLLLAVIFIYLIMVAQFQSLLSPFIVMFTMPLAFTGGMIGLLIGRQELSVLAMLGFVILAGVVVNNGIVFVSCVNDLRLEGMPRREALVEAGRMRMRPILMTALTTILAMSTMALGIGTGAEMGQSMAIVVIGGLTYATVLTLIVVPILYDIFNRKKELRVIDVGEDDLDETTLIQRTENNGKGDD